MEVIPAVDIRGGLCVRLHQGDYAAETVFAENPVAAAQRWIEAGATRIHVVDLDGAREGKPCNFDTIVAIARLGVPTQVGGGIRTAESVARYLEAGLQRVVLGTAVVRDHSLLNRISREQPEQLVVSLDARNNQLATDGWTQMTEISILEAAEELVACGVRRFIYTDIIRDGTLTAPNYTALTELVAALDCPLIAAGGVATLDQIPWLARIGVEGVIIGRALYDGRIALADAQAAASSGD